MKRGTTYEDREKRVEEVMLEVDMFIWYLSRKFR